MLLVPALALSMSACGLFEQPDNPLLGTWSTQDRNKVTFSPNAVIVAPDKGPATTMSAQECNGAYKLLYGRMETAALQRAFPGQADLTAKLKQLLTQPEYPVADVTCDRGGTSYLMLDNSRMLAVYRDGGVGGLEAYSRL